MNYTEIFHPFCILSFYSVFLLPLLSYVLCLFLPFILSCEFTEAEKARENNQVSSATIAVKTLSAGGKGENISAKEFICRIFFLNGTSDNKNIYP